MARSNIGDKTIFCHDNLEVMEGINSDCIDLIYLDPPFNKKKVFVAPTGSHAEGASFSDIFTADDIQKEWLEEISDEYPDIHALLESVNLIDGKKSGDAGRKSYNYCYLAYMAVRLIECHRILKDTGSLYLHCDPTMSHYLKLILDCIFNPENFQNEIVWHYRRWTGKSKRFQRLHDIVFFYSKSERYMFNKIYTDYTSGSKERKEQGVLHRFKAGEDPHLVSDGTVDSKGVSENDVWNIPFVAPSAKERVGYPTQKPLKLMERIIQASSNPGDLVLDPFCGCATTCVAAEFANRKWVGIDVSVKAYELVKQRLQGNPNTKQAPVENMFTGEIIYRTDPPKRTDQGKDFVQKKYVYVISHEKYPNEYKVGIATNWKTRLNSYQTGDPDRNYRMEFKILKTNARSVEKCIHAKYESKHEWVSGNLKDIVRDIKRHGTA